MPQALAEDLRAVLLEGMESRIRRERATQKTNEVGFRLKNTSLSNRAEVEPTSTTIRVMMNSAERCRLPRMRETTVTMQRAKKSVMHSSPIHPAATKTCR